MSAEAREFIEDWVDNNVHPTGYEPEGDTEEARKLTFECWRAVDQAGISRGAVQEEVGELLDYMSEAIERVNDAEVQRQVDKDKS